MSTQVDILIEYGPQHEHANVERVEGLRLDNDRVTALDPEGQESLDFLQDLFV